MKSARQKTTELERLAAIDEDAIDTSDMPEVTDWSKAEIGKFYRPVKKQITLRLDADVLQWFKAKGAGYQTVINEVLRRYATRRSAEEKSGPRTGEPCPASGIWCVEDDPSKSVAVSKGDPMPHVGRKKVKWVRRKAA